MSVSVVVPCYRSAAMLPELVTRINDALVRAVDRFEVILVVDGGPDDTWEVASGLAKGSPVVRAVRMARNYGQHNALVAGIRSAQFDVIVTIDDDLQHPPEEIPTALAALTDDLDLVYAVGAAEEHGAMRSWASRVVKAGLSGVLGVHQARQVSAFRVFRTFLREGFAGVSGPHVSVDVALSWGTTRIGAAEVRMAERQQGRSGYTFRTLCRHAVNMIVGYSTAPLRIVTYLGFLVGVAGLLLFVRMLWLYFGGATTVAGFTTISAMVALFSSAQMIAVGVLGEYVGRIHTSGMGRPTYVIRERVEPPRTEDQP